MVALSLVDARLTIGLAETAVMKARAKAGENFIVREQVRTSKSCATAE